MSARRRLTMFCKSRCTQTMAKNVEIDDFLQEWKKELSKPSTKPENHKKAKTGIDLPSGPVAASSSTSSQSQDTLHKSDSKTGELKCQLEKRRHNSYGDILGSAEEAKLRKNTLEPFLIAENLLEGKSGNASIDRSPTTSIQKSPSLPQNKRLKLSDSGNYTNVTKRRQEETFLDVFLKDLDEINEIPFFDLDLPRELAMGIFKHLNAQDLCRCAQVSKAWQSLAEDEYLWCQICHVLGYEPSTVTVEKQGWKQLVEEHVREERGLQANWKERHGNWAELKYVQGGVLSSCHSYGHLVAAGYTNGHVKFWNVKDDEECTFQPTETGLTLDAAVGTVTTYATQVKTSQKYTAAGYNQGTVDIWQNEDGNEAVYSFKGSGKITNVCLAQDRTLISASFDNCLQTVDFGESRDDEKLKDKLQMSEKIQHVTLIPSNQSCVNDLVALATTNMVVLHKIGDAPEDILPLHNVMYQKVGCLDNSDRDIVWGVGVFDDLDYSNKIQVKFFDISSQKEYLTLTALGRRLTCINVRDSPKDMIVTGCCDRKIRLFDTRIPDPVMTLKGHSGPLTCVQMDDWKVVSGGEDGLVCAWDQRMAAKLWEVHNRHPVRYCHFQENLLITANIPINKQPDNGQEEREIMTHRRYRGILQTCDFSVRQNSEGVLGICQSTYDEPEAYNYNIKLTVPYDNI